MIDLKICVYLLLFLAPLREINGTIEEYTELNTKAKRIGIKSNTLRSNRNQVVVNNTVYTIYMNNNIGKAHLEYTRNTLAKLHICINCEISRWTHNSLLQLITYVPILYQMKFLDIHNNLFMRSIELQKDDFDKIVNRIPRFINVLLRFISIHLSVYDTSHDSHVLKTLLTLSLEINYINTEYAEPYSYDYSDTVIVRIFLGVLNSLRRFMLLNCQPSYHNEYRTLNGDSTYRPRIKDADIDRLLDSVKQLNLESLETCDVKQMTLVKMINWRFYHIEWTTKYGAVKIQHVMQKIKKVRDLEKVFWYQKYMLNTIMKLLFKKIIYHFQKYNSLSATIVIQIQNLHSKMLLGVTNLPPALVNSFAVLFSKTQHRYTVDNDLVTAINSYLLLLDRINLEAQTNEDARTSPDNDSVIGYVKNLTIESLDDFLNYLNVIVNDFRCFIRLYEFLHSEYITDIGPTVDTLDKIKSFEQELALNYIQLRSKKVINEGCKFFHGLQQYCFNSLFYINQTQFLNESDRKPRDEIRKLFYEAYYILSSMMSDLNNFNYDYVPHVKTVNSLLVYIELIFYGLPRTYNDAKRMILTIMNELDRHSNEFCNPPDYNFLSYNNMNFGIVGLINTKVSNNVKNATSTMKDQLFHENHVHTPIKNLYRLFNNNSTTFATYSQVISIMWNGEKMDIFYIERSLIFNAAGPSQLYKYYGVLFKYSLAIIYYEIYKHYEKTQWSERKRIYFSAENPLEDEFPTYFNSIVKNIIKFSVDVVINLNEAVRIKYQFEGIGVTVDLNSLAGSSNINDVYWSHDRVQFRINTVLSFIHSVREHLSGNALYSQVVFGSTNDELYK